MNLELFQIVQQCSLIPLLWNIHEYLYDWRIWRYISFTLAIIFSVVYDALLINMADLVVIKSIFDRRDDLFDVFKAIIGVYVLILFVPTYVVNFEILIKELTLN